MRTFAPIVAGVGHMEYRTFVSYNVLGGLPVGRRRHQPRLHPRRVDPDIDKYLLPVIGVIVLLSVAPVAWEIRKARKESKGGPARRATRSG